MCIGKDAGQNGGNSQYSIFIGSDAGASGSSVGDNCILIGRQAAVSTANVDNEITLGNSSIDKLRIPGLSFEIAPSAVTQGGVFYENHTTLSADYTITDGRNAMAAGPITINNGITLTIGSGESVTIV